MYSKLTSQILPRLTNPFISVKKSLSFRCPARLKLFFQSERKFSIALEAPIHEPYENIGSEQTKLLSACKDGKLSQAETIFFKLIQNVELKTICWNHMIAMYAKCGRKAEAIELFQQVALPNVSTFKIMIGLFIRQLEISHAHEMFLKMQQMHIKPDILILNSMIAMYAKANRFEEATKIFKMADQPNAVTFNIMIGLYYQLKRIDDAVKLFNEMKFIGIDPNPVTAILGTMINIIENSIFDIGCNESEKMVFETEPDLKTGCGEKNAQEMEKIHSQIKTGRNEKVKDLAYRLPFGPFVSIIENHPAVIKLLDEIKSIGIKFDTVTFNSIIYLCALAKRPDESKKLFNEMIKFRIEPTIDTFKARIIAYLNSSKASESESVKAVDMIFKEMKALGFFPDSVTFNAMIAVYGMAGRTYMVEETVKEMMSLSIEPDVVTYSLMIEMYLKLRKFIEAERMFYEMKNCKIKPNVKIWKLLINLFIKTKRYEEADKIFYWLKENKVKDLGWTI